MRRITPVIALALSIASPALAQTATDGKKVFNKCKACHQVGPDAKNKSGPILTDVIGRAAGSVDGFKYSKSMIAAGASGLVWSQDAIVDYIADPSKYLKALLSDPKARAKMTFKLKDADDRRAVVAYLASFSTAAADIPKSGFCIINASDAMRLFATETREGIRQLAELAPGDRLCADETSADDGIISVFANSEGFEGCSRIIATGTGETMHEYAEFDRCRWGAHDS
jgi:cytochrome c2